MIDEQVNDDEETEIHVATTPTPESTPPTPKKLEQNE